MEKWKAWLGFKKSLLFSAKSMVLEFTSRLRSSAREKNHGLVNLYKDMESCGEYTDIQVMWELIQSSYSPNGYIARRRRKRAYWKFRFRTHLNHFGRGK